ncbi:response regulator transcription factor [Bacillus luteolus]|uniref:Response regulator transcription factor n=1 Tax=Litchfieldia luteola TaxID=682179 RepID=A0ABR9QFB3_9BACI|nr:response regulator transcription factor [Cytobacillus luteolus]MBE4907177.1 response regulator transcription factor [Cytobacillus luteolus]MBP1943352.1 DNA-binding NarL/FixJ family response regulator [Cytobacillus luteolus]
MHRVVVADDHQIVKDGLKILLGASQEFEVVGEACNGDEAVEKTIRTKPDLLLTDLKMPGSSIINGSVKIKQKLPNIKIVVLTAFDDSEDIYRAMKAGINGYIMKDTSPDKILNTLRMVMDGYSIFQPKINEPNENKKDQFIDKYKLTEREHEVLLGIIENLNNADIAKKLYISETTVKTHVSNILKKTGQSNRAQAVLFALQEGFLQVKGGKIS